ncbi:hypothetical protein [Actinomycetospora sp. NBC_00405]|uniref:hypothetical protein n=1 Tax=Actinomycetospora sp. NBC_00405 TaxID=2975952 RepID=UPI002E1BC1E3
MATRRFWPGRRSETARPPTPTPPSGPQQGSSGAPLSHLPGVSFASASPEERRFAQVYAADRVGPMPYPNQATPDIGAARGRVRTLVAELLEGVDEGTGSALDPLIASWASGWLSRIDSQHADHQAVIDRLVGGARQQLADAEAAHERDRRALAIARRDYDDARERLTEPVGGEDDRQPVRRDAGRHADRTGDRTGARGGDRTEDFYVPPADPPTGPLPRPPSGRGPAGPSTYTAPSSPDRGDPMTDDRADRADRSGR